MIMWEVSLEIKKALHLLSSLGKDKKQCSTVLSLQSYYKYALKFFCHMKKLMTWISITLSVGMYVMKQELFFLICLFLYKPEISGPKE